jgi:hypothetical protein
VLICARNSDGASLMWRWGTGELDSVWTDVALLNGWVNYGGNFYNASYRKVADRVELRGLIKTHLFPVVTHNGTSYIPGRLDVLATGSVQVLNVGANFVSLDGIAIQAEQ